MSRDALAAACGVTTYTIANWEKGRSAPGLQAAFDAADALGCGLRDFVRSVPERAR